MRLVIAGVAFLLVMPLSSAAAQGAPAPERTAGDVMKNVQLLKNVPLSEWTPMMQFISGSLGVSCELCHTVGKFESDSKKTKLKAREMITMTRVINDNNFGGKLVVTCNTCHQGSTHPNGTPKTWDKNADELTAYRNEIAAVVDTAKPAAPPPPAVPAASLPTVAEVFAMNRKAIGGVPSSMHVAGTFTSITGSRPFELYTMGADKVLIGSLTQGPRPRQTLNGDHGWVVTAQGKTPLNPAQVAGVRNAASIFQAVRFADAPAHRAVRGVERIGDHSYNVVVDSLDAHQRRLLYFDVQSGLLYKVRNEFATPLGTRVDEILFEDYRTMNGANLAHSITLHYMEDRFEYRVTDLQTNIALDPSTFDPPTHF
jgi:hypothetical protein